jgi:hypothetical protein
MARTIAQRLMSHLGLVEPAAMIVGSIRREKPEVGDIEIIAPLPAEAEDDKLYRALRDCLEPADAPSPTNSLFAGAEMPRPRFRTIGRVVQGCKPLFKSCRFILHLKPETIRDLPARELQVDLFRYEVGGGGNPSNRGWIELMRTGSGEFSTAFLMAWKNARGILGTAEQGSQSGYLVDERGQKRHTPNECAAFQVVGLVWVPPHLRGDATALLAAPGTTLWKLQKATAREQAMRLLGLEAEAQITQRFNEDRLTAMSARL